MTNKPSEQKNVSTTPTAPPLVLNWRRRLLGMGILAIGLMLVLVFATTLGSVHIPFLTTLSILLNKLPFVHLDANWTSSLQTIVIDIRLPRIIMAATVGVGLAMAGATYQGLFRNPLADPYLIGVAQGAALGAVIGFLLPFNWSGNLVPFLAFIGALSAVAIVYFLARVGGMLPVTTLILAGVAAGALFQAIVSYLLTIAGTKLNGIVFWLMGSFSSSDWSDLKITLPTILIGGLIILMYARPLNLIQLGEDQAKQLGIDVEKMKIILLLAATMVTAAAVSYVGIIGFVGIVVPHAVRLIWGADYRFLLPFSALVGAIFMVSADIVARTVVPSAEVPIGVITAFCGAPFFLYLLRKRSILL